MSKDRFKVGDVVKKVRYVPEPNGDDHPIGSKVVIIQLDGDGIPLVSFLDDESDDTYIGQDCYELAHLAESPLIKALE